MSYNRISIIVKEENIENAKEKALDIFSSESKDLCTGVYHIIPEECLSEKEILEDEGFSNMFKSQTDRYGNAMKQIINWEPQLPTSVEDAYKALSEYSKFIIHSISTECEIYDGENYMPLLSLESLRENHKNKYLITIKYQY